ncbi:MAG: IS5 family transposase [Segetibacter sp.]
MARALKTRASKQQYISTNQVIIPGFETPFHKHLNATNRWVVLSAKMPWDELVNVYQKQMNNSKTGADGINPRVVIGALIIKHMCDLSDRETVQQIQENMYMQYFLGFSSFSDEEPFDASLFVEFRKRLGTEQINAINQKILQLSAERTKQSVAAGKEGNPSVAAQVPEEQKQTAKQRNEEVSVQKPAEVQAAITHDGKLIVDATACPQDISYPTDLNLLNDAREKTEELIDFLYSPLLHKKKPRTYRKVARKLYLKTAQKKVKSKKEIRNAIKKQLGFLSRNIKNTHTLLAAYTTIPFNVHQHKYFLVVQTLYDQQARMYKEKIHTIEHRIVSIHQPHVRPIVRGKTNAKVEFGAKINLSLVNGFAFLEDLLWDAFNEGTRLIKTVEQYKARLGHYPKEVLADKIYCNRANRAKLKELGIVLVAKALGRPRAQSNLIRPGQRNPIEGKFGQAKTTYGMNRIKARLQQTSQSWIATIIMVLNLVKLTGQVPFCLIQSLLSYSATGIKNLHFFLRRLATYNYAKMAI